MKQQCFMSILFESLILAQDERWRRALCMQVERRLCAAQRGLEASLFVASKISKLRSFKATKLLRAAREISGGRVSTSKERTFFWDIARRKTG